MTDRNSMGRPTWIEIDLEALAFNYHSTKSFIGDEVKFMAVIKGNAYGHGAARCAIRLEAEGVEWFGVATPEEALELRDSGISRPILCFDGFWPGQEDILFDHDITPAIISVEKLGLLQSAAAKSNKTISVHIKIDTGMGRVGVRHDQLPELIAALKRSPNLRIEALMTHFSSADDTKSADFTALQMARFHTVLQTFAEHGITPTFVDLANSPAAVGYPPARPDMVRLGGVLYGLNGILPEGLEAPKLKPVLSLHSRIEVLKRVPKGETLGYGRTFTTARESLIATIPIGYEDGFPRTLSNKGVAIVNGSLVPVVGRVSMDWTILDVTDALNVKVDDEVILIGESGGSSIGADDLATAADTIAYEVTCGLGSRLTRVYSEKPGRD